MTAGQTQATIRLHGSGTVLVDPFIRLSDRTFIHCCVYGESAPILAVDDGNVSLSLTVPDVDKVTGEDVQRARSLAEAVAKYVAGLEDRLAVQDAGEAA